MEQPVKVLKLTLKKDTVVKLNIQKSPKRIQSHTVPDCYL